MDKSILVKVFVILALVFTVFAIIGWMVFVGGFGNQTVTMGLAVFNLAQNHYLWVITVISPILFIFMIIKCILLLLNMDVFKKYYIIHFLSAFVIALTIVVVCNAGIALSAEVLEIRQGQGPTHAENAILAGTFLEIVFLGLAWICFSCSHLFGAGLPSSE